MKKLIIILTLMITVSIAKAQYRPLPYVAIGSCVDKTGAYACSDVGVIFPIYKRLSASVQFESMTNNFKEYSHFYGVRCYFKVFDNKHLGFLYYQTELMVKDNKTMFNNFGYCHIVPVYKNLSLQLTATYGYNSFDKFKNGSIGGAVYFCYTF